MPDEADFRKTIALTNLGAGLTRSKRFEEALPILQANVLRGERLNPDNWNDIACELSNLGTCYMMLDNDAEAVRCLRRAQFGFSTALGPQHPSTINANHNLACALTYMDRFEEAAAVLREQLAIATPALGPDDITTISANLQLGHVLTLQEKLAEAGDVLEATVRRSRRVLGATHPTTRDGLRIADELRVRREERGEAG